ncbi:outer membrane protein transport protein [Aeromonas jandaei]|uniref:outer membrane protein transport protein n=1 Tax=Aeromonas jandaei TaxID=650 RepID=UPI00191E5387|nr:outer membrane protein transport protein [Aeromonas jandaei]MBL0628170.1 outer membrane protein transport protein [Aeromonas jandaei]
MHSTLKLSALSLLVIAGHAHAAGFQLAEQSATGLGRAFAGEAAIADNATVLGRNPGAITRFKQTALSGGIIYLRPDVNIEGRVNDRLITVTGSQPTADKPADAMDVAGDAWIPNFYLVTPINDQLSAGLSISSQYGLGIEMPKGYSAGHFGNVSDIKTAELGGALAYQFSPLLSAGFGISLIRGEGEVGGTFPHQNKIAKHLEGTGNEVGWNVGILLTPSEQTRIGMTYRNGVNMKLKGNAIGINSSTGQTFQDTGYLVLPLPATAELALYQQLTGKLVLHSSINWTDWSKFVALDASLDHQGEMHIKEENWQDSLRYSLGVSYQLTPQWQLRSGLAYDQSPVPAANRTISIPDADRLWYSLGMGYQYSKALSIDVGITFIDGKKVDVHETFSQPVRLRNGAPASYQSHFDGTSEGDAWLAGLQMSYLF